MNKWQKSGRFSVYQKILSGLFIYEFYFCKLETYLNVRLKGKYLQTFKEFEESWNTVNDETNKIFFEEEIRFGASLAHDRTMETQEFCGRNDFEETAFYTEYYPPRSKIRYLLIL